MRIAVKGGGVRMRCKLMHKKVPVALLEFDEITGVFTKIYDIINQQHLPVGISVLNGIVDRRELHTWWLGRAIPTSRLGLKEALERLDISTTAEMLGRSFGLNLSDQYWIMPEEINLDWEEVNFFENEFSEDIGNILIGLNNDSDDINYMSPDTASDGWLKKKWRIVDGERILFKGGSGPHYQEPYNEVLATSVMKRLGIECAEYTLMLIGDKPYSACKDFITSQTELITANSILKTKKKPNNKSLYEHYVNLCMEKGVTDIQHRMNQMLTLDFIIVNEDRHLNNFGLIRNAETLEYVGVAPIYDNGTSMWFNTAVKSIKAGAMDINSKPFKTNHYDQIKLVSDYDWLEIDKLKGIDEEFSEILKTSEYIDSARRDALCNALNMRIEMLKNTMNQNIKYTNIQQIGEEVKEDIAYSGQENSMPLES